MSIFAPGPFGGVSTAPLDDVVPVTPGNGDLPNGPCRAIIATVGGTVNVTTAKGDRDSVPIAAGVALPIVALKIRAGGTATGLFAGY